MEKIKLVIWDLDETFWQGTLSEGEISIPSQNIEIVKSLTNRGIINSIVSKNDFDSVKNILQKAGIWDLFVFPVISWTPKGEAVKNIIERCQLRASNTLFIDDNISNIKEVEFYNPGINTKMPDFINEILDNESCIGKNDSTHTRLKQYKILEEKEVERSNFFDNISFLEDSNIQITFNKKGLSADRVHELIERTNQLNYTKIRLDKDQVEVLLNDNLYEHCTIEVTDKYGNYGIVGYYCFDRKNNKLIHFVFSCRILNLGIEQYIYAKLNFPEIKIVPDVSTPLDNSMPHWISSKEDAIEKDLIKEKKHNHIIFKGGCDLSQMLHYISGKYCVDITQETNYVSTQNVSIHNDHTLCVLNSITLPDRKSVV